MSTFMKTRDWGTNRVEFTGFMPELVPAELHHKSNGAYDREDISVTAPSFVLVLNGHIGARFYTQISLTELTEALGELGYTLHKP